MDTITTPLQRLRDVVRQNDTITACSNVLDALNNPRPAGRMRDWMTLNHGRKVTTIQVGPGGTWAPTGRTIDAKTRATMVRLDGSTREYAGFRVIHAYPRVLIVESVDTAVAYVLED